MKLRQDAGFEPSCFDDLIDQPLHPVHQPFDVNEIIFDGRRRRCVVARLEIDREVG
jgi:hypothetical protein